MTLTIECNFSIEICLASVEFKRVHELLKERIQAHLSINLSIIGVTFFALHRICFKIYSNFFQLSPSWLLLSPLHP